MQEHKENARGKIGHVTYWVHLCRRGTTQYVNADSSLQPRVSAANTSRTEAAAAAAACSSTLHMTARHANQAGHDESATWRMQESPITRGACSKPINQSKTKQKNQQSHSDDPCMSMTTKKPRACSWKHATLRTNTCHDMRVRCENLHAALAASGACDEMMMMMMMMMMVAENIPAQVACSAAWAKQHIHLEAKASLRVGCECCCCCCCCWH